MNKRTILAQRRQIILAQSAVQRDSIAFHGHALMQSLSPLDKGLSLLSRIKKSALLGGLMVGVIAIKPRRLFSLLQTGFVTWQTLRKVTPLLRNIITRHRTQL